MSATDEVLVLTVGGMHCPSCGLLIDEVVEELPGVASSATNVRTGRTVVRPAVPDGAAFDRSAVVATIHELGYTATIAVDATSAEGST